MKKISNPVRGLIIGSFLVIILSIIGYLFFFQNRSEDIESNLGGSIYQNQKYKFSLVIPPTYQEKIIGDDFIEISNGINTFSLTIDVPSSPTLGWELMSSYPEKVTIFGQEETINLFKMSKEEMVASNIKDPTYMLITYVKRDDGSLYIFRCSNLSESQVSSVLKTFSDLMESSKSI